MARGDTSRRWRERFEKAVHYGSSTMSKAPRFLPEEPAALVRGKGCRVWDVEGREFIDFRNSLGPITLGYAFPAVDKAVTAQLARGIVFGHPHVLECEVAEKLIEVIPCAEQVRFLKTGGEACAACIRIARAHTGRDHVIHIGYNGWLNSLAAKGRVLPGRVSEGVPAGVPAALSALHHQVGWNDMPAIEALFAEHRDGIAAVIVAADYVRLAEGKTFYPKLRRITKQHGALLIYDEIVTGFRVAMGGVQEYFKVTPDLAVFAKGIANGMPLSVFAGRKKFMAALDRATVSSTYGGETLSLAAAKAAIGVYRKSKVIDHLWTMGEKMWGGCNALYAKYGLPMAWKGLPVVPILTCEEGAPKDLMERFLRAAYAHGLSFYGAGYVNFSHKEADIVEALERMEAVCEALC